MEVTMCKLKFNFVLLRRTNLAYGVQSVITLRIVCVNQRAICLLNVSSVSTALPFGCWGNTRSSLGYVYWSCCKKLRCHFSWYRVHVYGYLNIIFVLFCFLSSMTSFENSTRPGADITTSTVASLKRLGENTEINSEEWKVKQEVQWCKQEDLLQ